MMIVCSYMKEGHTPLPYIYPLFYILYTGSVQHLPIKFCSSILVCTKQVVKIGIHGFFHHRILPMQFLPRGFLPKFSSHTGFL